MPRRTRVTIRCLVDDLGISLPDQDTDIGSLDHPLIDETRRITPSSPRGQKRIAAIKHPMVYRVRHGRYRGATWLDDAEVVWLLGAAEREEGSPDDAFEHFESLSRDGNLLPTEADTKRDRIEAGTRFLRTVADEATRFVGESWASPGLELTRRLSDRLGVILYSNPGRDELWLALSRRDTAGAYVSDHERDLVFELFRQAVGESDWQEVLPDEWPTRALQWEWVARLYVHG